MTGSAGTVKGKMGRATVFAILALGASLGLSGCNSVKEQFAAAGANVRATRPLVEWVGVMPEHLADVDPARLEGEGAALVIGRSVRETSAGDRSGTSDNLLLRDVSTSTIRESAVQKTGSDAEVGWSVLIVPPGQYILNRSATLRRAAINRATGQLKEFIADQNGHPFVPLAQTTHIGAGDVVYIGTVVWRTGPNVEPFQAEIRDQHEAAVTWTREHLPTFASRLQTRLLPRPVRPLS
jgi:hypothetical protein